jgi:hypothetical protein
LNLEERENQMFFKMTRPYRSFSVLSGAAFAASCATTELSVPSSHPGNPQAAVAQVTLASPLQGTPGSAESSSAPQEAAPQEHSHEHATMYTCPMHPEIIRDKPGNCPICGMKLVPKKESK